MGTVSSAILTLALRLFLLFMLTIQQVYVCKSVQTVLLGSLFLRNVYLFVLYLLVSLLILLIRSACSVAVV